MKKKGLSALFQPVELTQGECWKTILAFSFPIIVSYLLQQVYTISDAAIVGQTLTAQEVAGVNDTTSLIFIFLQFAFGVSAGFCVVTSCNVGAHNPAGVRRSLTTQIVLSAALTVILTVLALLLLDPMLAWINVTPDNGEVYRAAYTYCAIIFAGIGALFVYPPTEIDAVWTWETLAGYLYIIVVGTALAFVCYLKSLDYVPPAVTTILGASEPLTAVILSVVLLGTSFTPVESLGAVLIFATVFILAMREGRRRA